MPKGSNTKKGVKGFQPTTKKTAVPTAATVQTNTKPDVTKTSPKTIGKTYDKTMKLLENKVTNPENVIDMIMDTLENGFDYMLTHSGYAEEPTNLKFDKTVAKYLELRKELGQMILDMAKTPAVVERANEGGTDNNDVGDDWEETINQFARGIK